MLTIVKNVGGKWTTIDTVQTERGARTLTLDPKTLRIYLLAAEYGLRRPNQARSRDVRRSCQTAFKSWWSVNSARAPNSPCAKETRSAIA
jgi:hypothetical protein